MVLGLLCVGVFVRSIFSTSAGKGTGVAVTMAIEKQSKPVTDHICTSNSTDSACKFLLTFSAKWNTANAKACQEAMDTYVPQDIGVELALSKTSYILIYHENVGLRFGEYFSSGEFDFATDDSTHWTVRPFALDEVTASRPMTMFMDVGWFKMHAMFIVLRSRPGGFPGSRADDVENCPDGCRANVWVRMKKENGDWIVREVAVIKLE